MSEILDQFGNPVQPTNQPMKSATSNFGKLETLGRLTNSNYPCATSVWRFAASKEPPTQEKP